MHYCGFIIKSKKMEATEARTIAGEALLEKGVCDYYSTDASRVFKDDKKVISIQEFKEVWQKWEAEIKDEAAKYANDERKYPAGLFTLCVIQDGYVDNLLSEEEFYQFWGSLELEEVRKELIITYTKAYLIKMGIILNEVDENEMDVCLLDYHD